MASEHPAIFKKLKSRFRKGHSSGILLSVCRWHPNDGLELAPSVSRVYEKEFTVIESISIPVISPRLCADFSGDLDEELKRRIADLYVMASSQVARRKTRSQTHSGELNLVVYAPTNNHEDRKAAKQLKSFMHAGGANLPLSVLNTVPWQWEPRAYESRWLELMFWNNPPSLSDLTLLNLPLNEHRPIFWRPFEHSVKVIESCRLETEGSVFRTVDGEWPIWAGEICRPVGRQNAFKNEPGGRKDDPWHKADDIPPEVFEYGPLSGTKMQLSRWICPLHRDKARSRPITAKLTQQRKLLWGQVIERSHCLVFFAKEGSYLQARDRCENDKTPRKNRPQDDN